MMTENYLEIPIRNIEIDVDNNPRKEMEDNKSQIENLADNIEENFLLNPVTVEKIGDNQYKIIAGYRRLQAFINLHMRYQNVDGYDGKYAIIPAILRENVKDTVFMALSENLARKDMTEEEKAKAIYLLKKETEDTVRDIAYKLGISKSYVGKLYKQGKQLANPQPLNINNGTLNRNQFNPDNVKDLMKVATTTISAMKDISILDTEGKADLTQKAKQLVDDLQDMITYIRKTEKELLNEADVKKLIKEQKKIDKLNKKRGKNAQDK